MAGYDLDVDCGVELGMRPNGDRDGFPFHYYALLTPVDGSGPVEVSLPLDLYQDLIDVNSGVGRGRLVARVSSGGSRLEVTVDLYAGKDKT